MLTERKQKIDFGDRVSLFPGKDTSETLLFFDEVLIGLVSRIVIDLDASKHLITREVSVYKSPYASQDFIAYMQEQGFHVNLLDLSPGSSEQLSPSTNLKPIQPPDRI